MRLPSPDALRRNAQQLRREELARIAAEGAIEWSTLIRRIRVLTFRPACPAPARNPRPA
jgi:anaerobic glycerol-3-phosphate dehydrogenase